MLRFCSALSGVVLSMPALAAPMQCPPRLQVEQRATNVPTGLRAFDTKTPHNWTNVQFSDGAPDQQAWLAPDSTRKAGKSFVNIWNFGGPGTWMACAYTGTTMVMAFRLPDTIRSCEARYDATLSPPSTTAVDCR